MASLTTYSDKCDSIKIFQLDNDDGKIIKQLCAEVSQSPYENFENFYQQIKQVQNSLPSTLTEPIKNFFAQSYAGVLLIKNFPISASLMQTPLTPFANDPVYVGTEPALCAFASLIAEPFSFKEWDAGYLIHNKYPIKSHRDIQFGSNAVEFLVHTETPFRDFSPDYLALFCIRGDPKSKAATYFADIKKIIQSLSQEEIDILRKPCFAFLTDNPAFEYNGMKLTLPMPIITHRNEFELYEYVHDLVAVTDDAIRVLKKLKDLVEFNITNVFLETGDLAIIDNSHMIHGRSAYEPEYLQNDRWLQRMLLTKRLFNKDEIPTSRLIPDKKLQNYPTDYQNVLRGLCPESKM